MKNTYELADVVIERDGYWALNCPELRCWKIFRINGTHSVRCGIIGWAAGLARVQSEINRQIARTASK